MTTKPVSPLLTALLLALLAAPAHADRALRAELELAAPVADAWNAWFDPEGKPGERGAEGMRIVGVEPMKRFAFLWNAPPSIPTIRAQRTLVVLDFAALDSVRTRLRFTEFGWGEGADWDRAYAYFDRAWGAVVLPRLRYRFEHGPVDWKAPPELPPLPSMQVRLAELSATASHPAR
jgi:uncharacterized protein YndB with AHSA1/START domain